MRARASSRLARALAAAALATALGTGCGRTPEPALVSEAANAQRGDVQSVERVGVFPMLATKLLVWWSGLSDRLPVEHGVTLYRVGYWTLGEGDETVAASGLVAFPRGTAPPRGVVSWQHGTLVTRSEAPSKPSADEGVLAAIAFAGHGYVLAAPDYVGHGLSQVGHPYYVTPVVAANVVDLLRAAREVAAARGTAWPEPVLLTGFSQGGHATIAALRALEKSPEAGLRVAGAAPIAGPFDLSGLSVPRALQGEARSSSLYLAYLAVSYARAYGEPLGTLLREPWRTRAPELFDGSHTGEAVLAALPRDPRELFTPEFLADADAGRAHWLWRRLRENDLTAFTPAAPVRLYYGSLDVDVSPEEARRQARRWQARGADAEAIDVGAFDHEASVLEAAPRVRDWFDALVAKETR